MNYKTKIKDLLLTFVFLCSTDCLKTNFKPNAVFPSIGYNERPVIPLSLLLEALTDSRYSYHL